MRNRFAVVLASFVSSGLLLAAVPASAHHAFAASYDADKPITIEGTVTKVMLINPHSFIFIDVKSPDGTVAHWEITGAGPQALRSNGMTRIFSVGQTLKVTYAPARDGSNTGRVVTFTFADGRTVTMYHEDPNNPNDL